MMLQAFLVVWSLFLVLGSESASESTPTNPLLLIIGFDGVRYDFINNERTPFLWKLAQEGVYSPRGIQSQMMTVSAPNFYSMSTGLYQESTGVLGNVMWDPEWKTHFDWWNETGSTDIWKQSRDAKWYSGEPIWQTNERAGNFRKSGAMRWNHCDVPINGQSMDEGRCVPWKEVVSEPNIWRRDIDQLVQWFIDPENPINLGLYYNLYVDEVQHSNDIYSAAVLESLAKIDDLVAYLFQRLDQANILQHMNFVFVSDHGFTNFHSQSNIVQLNIDPKMYERAGNNLFVEEGTSVDELHAILMKARNEKPTFEVYRKEEIPESWHYKNHRRVGDLVILNKLGYFTALGKSDVPDPGSSNVVGLHGYSKFHEEMRPFFFAYGPEFKKGVMLDLEWQGETTDLYNLWCHVLKIAPSQNNGSMENVKMMLVNDSCHILPSFLSFMLFTTLFLLNL